MFRGWSPFLMLLAVLLALLAVAAAAAQEGTVNLPLAQTWQSDQFGWQLQTRNWNDNDFHEWDLGARGKISDQTEACLTYLDFKTSELGYVQPNSVAPAVSSISRQVDLRLLAFNIKQQLFGDARHGLVSAQGAFEFATSDTRLGDQENFLALGLPIQWGDSLDRTVFLLEPRLVGFDDTWYAGDPWESEGLGTVAALSGGVVQRLGGDWSLLGDATVVVSGHNSADEDTGELLRKLVWGLGLRWTIPGDKLQVLDLFSTNAFGTSPVTSVVAVPGNHFGWGARYELQF
jgi:hypothetical protein